MNLSNDALRAWRQLPSKNLMEGCFNVTWSYSRDMSTEYEAVGMAIPDGFRLQESRPAALDFHG